MAAINSAATRTMDQKGGRYSMSLSLVPMIQTRTLSLNSIK
jgi:hypothetical protein